MIDDVLQALTIMVLVAHLIALGAALIIRTVKPVLQVNLIVSLGVLTYFVFHPRLFGSPVDVVMLVFGAFEAAVFVGSAIGLRGARAVNIASSAVFAVHLLASGAAVAFTFLFRITRLI